MGNKQKWMRQGLVALFAAIVAMMSVSLWAATVSTDAGGVVCNSYTNISVDASGNFMVNGCGSVTPGVTTVGFSQGSFAVSEGSSASITLARSGGSLASSLTVVITAIAGGTAVAGTDYTAWGSGTVTFAANQATTTFSIATLHNAASTTDMKLNLQLALQGSPSGVQLGVQNAILTITNTDGSTGSCPTLDYFAGNWAGFANSYTLGYSGANLNVSPTAAKPAAIKISTGSSAVASGIVAYQPHATSNYVDVDVAISSCPGDFATNVLPGCGKMNFQSGNIRFSIGGSSYCKLQVNKEYYINIRPTTASSISGGVFTRY